MISRSKGPQVEQVTTKLTECINIHSKFQIIFRVVNTYKSIRRVISCMFITLIDIRRLTLGIRTLDVR